MKHRPWHWAAIAGVLVALSVFSLGTGVIDIPATHVVDALRGNGDAATISIIRNLRLPRILLGMLVGAGLGMSGGALQGTLRNGLAEPYLLGVSGGAAVGAVIAFAFNASNAAIIGLAAFAGAAGAVILALVVARASGVASRGDPRTLLMAGVVIGAFANAVIMIALANAPPNTIRGALWWMMGSVADSSWSQLPFVAGFVGVGAAMLIYWAREIDLLALGDEAAAALGVDVEGSARRIYLLAALLAAATVAAAGLIGFVGLIVPHIVRAAGIRHHRPLIIAAAIVGAILVVAADLAARTVAPPGELPLGAVTAILGVPFFLAQLRKAR
ncbi:MAG TPA: iron ABC transporter permease [Gemmatimonadaceae bacterium]|nr:iron ABC transporter permease [Gemmatimonadaceae bacterium]